MATTSRTMLLPSKLSSVIGSAKLNSFDHHGLNQPEDLDCHAVRYVQRLAPNNYRSKLRRRATGRILPIIGPMLPLTFRSALRPRRSGRVFKGPYSVALPAHAEGLDHKIGLAAHRAMPDAGCHGPPPTRSARFGICGTALPEVSPLARATQPRLTK